MRISVALYHFLTYVLVSTPVLRK